MKNQINDTHRTRETIRGTVLPAQWDTNFRVTGLLIACRNEREVRVGNLDSFPMLMNLERNEVELTGTVHRDQDGETIEIDRVLPL